VTFTRIIESARAALGPTGLTGPAVDALLAASLPDAGAEIWRYSRIGELDLDTFSFATASTAVTPAASASAGASLGLPADATDVFADANALLSRPAVVTVAAGQIVAEPIYVTHDIVGDDVVVFPRLVIDAGPNSEVTIVERFTSGVARVLVCPVLELRAHPSARVRYLGINALGPNAWLLAAQQAEGHRDSTITLATVAFGGDYARVRTECRLVGQGAHAEQLGVSFGELGQMHDLRVLQEHVAPRTTSNLLFKGAVQDESTSVYTGLIRIGKDARGSVAFQTNRNLKLSDKAWAESVPNLDIENNDVRCSHASSIGPIDPDQRFYLESRGIPSGIAERLIILGFFDEVLARLPGGRADLGSFVTAKLDHRQPAALAS